MPRINLRTAWIATFLIATLSAAPASLAAKKKPAKETTKKVPFSDAAVQNAIEKGVEYLWAEQEKDGSWQPPTKGKNVQPVDSTALAAYALLECGVKVSDPRMKKALEYMASHPSESTYGMGLRCCAWASAARQDKRFDRYLRKDVSQVVRSMRADGAYGYRCSGRPEPVKGGDSWSNSRTQYGVLGAWMGQLRGIEVPTRFWQVSLKHWLKEQKPDGGWGYNRHHADFSTVSMTVAGMASVYVCMDNLYQTRFLRCGRNTELPVIEKGLEYLAKNYPEALKRRSRNWVHYTLYGVERVALASGVKYFGKHDWYRKGAGFLINTQDADGGWTKPKTFGPRVSTGYALLFLVRGQKPVLVNKLRFEGDWNNRPRDMANLTRWVSKQFEATLNWQMIGLASPVREWHDAPILYLSGSNGLKLDEEHIEKLRTYVLQGGTILSVTECAGAKFRDGIRDVYKRMFPDYELTPVPADHRLYSIHFKLQGQPEMYMLSNGVRPLAIHTDVDLSRSWQANRFATKKADFQAAVNMAAYVTDKQFRNRGTTVWPAEPKRKAEKTVKAVRVKHNGNWNPEPLALDRFARLLQDAEGVRLELLPAATPGKLPASGASVAFLTGTRKPNFSPEDRAALKKFVEAGGTLVIDAAGGSAGGGKVFADAIEKELGAMYGIGGLRELALLSPVYQQPDRKIEKAGYRRMTRMKLGGKRQPNLRGMLAADGRVAVIYSGEDLTAALAGASCTSLDGYTPDSAYEIVRNIVMPAAR